MHVTPLVAAAGAVAGATGDTATPPPPPYRARHGGGDVFVWFQSENVSGLCDKYRSRRSPECETRGRKKHPRRIGGEMSWHGILGEGRFENHTISMGFPRGGRRKTFSVVSDERGYSGGAVTGSYNDNPFAGEKSLVGHSGVYGLWALVPHTFSVTCRQRSVRRHCRAPVWWRSTGGETRFLVLARGALARP